MKESELAFIAKLPDVGNALQSGLKKYYGRLKMADEDQKPHELFPIIKDPTLVKATQMVLQGLQQSHKDIVSVIRVYSGIKTTFDQLLKARLHQNHVKEE